MGQQPSKKSRKSSKDKDKDLPDVAQPDAQLDAADDNTSQSSISRATGSTTLNGSDPNPHSNGQPSISVSDPAGAPVASPAEGSRAHGSPYPANALISNIDQSPELAPIPSPLPSPKTGSAPLDIPATHTILANGTPLTPGSVNSNGNGATPESLGNGGAKERLKQFDVDDMIQRLLGCWLYWQTRDVFLSQPTLIELSPPVKIVGDVHGQYSDLIRLFEMCGFPPAANYLFLGDYVDRGKQSLETILLLLCYKIKYPENFFLLRGNHECANVTRVYGFYDECKRRCNIKTWKTFIDVFNCLPIAAIVASKIFCVHGGLSPSLHSMDDIKRIQRPTDVPDYGLLNDLLWSDPSDTALDWEDNERGVSYCFGKAIINEFLVRYDMDLICRAHMVVEDGYEFWNDRTLVTVFSAPNYCGEFDNYGACMSVSEDLLCAFELLKPLDGAALRKEMTKVKRKSVMSTAS
ncbi:hypothetical protein D9613_001789 [Agrocybe pediades]|uniref:Serine/threonine-protein phosphatase n=1 Tax=Agrocybe pediades TaxID=84607 RepID=A0A8H4R7A4_9AGAR|nr:hypothetical protein D9613_001789 [Agrocybe pediades]